MKKIISFLLVFCIVMSSLSAFAKVNLNPGEVIDDIFRFDVGDFASQSGTVSSKDTDHDLERIKLLTKLGVWDTEEKSKNDLVTMTEFAVIMSKLRLGTENAFADIYKNNVNEEKVTYAIAYEYLIDALGYYHECGQFNYTDEALIIVADKIGLISDSPANIKSYITRAELSKLVHKALTIDMCVMEYTDYGYSYNVKDGENLLSKMHGIYTLEGFVNAIPDLSVYGDATLREGYFTIDRTEVFAGEYDISEFFGNRVLAYAEYDEVTGKRTLIAISYAEDNNVVEVDFSSIDRINSYELTYVDAEGTEQEIDLRALKYVTDNGRSISSITELTNYANTDGKIVFASTEGDGFDAAMIYRYGYYTVAYNDLNQGAIGFKYGQKYSDGNGYLTMDDKATTVCYLDGEKADYKTIPANAAIRVFRAVDTNYTEIYASTAKISGTINMIDGNIVTVDDKDYFVPDMILKHIEDSKNDTSITYNEKLKPFDLGVVGTFYVIDKTIVSYTSTTDYTIGYLKDVKTSRSSLDPSVTLRIFTQNADWAEATVAEKIELDGVGGKTREDFLNLVTENSGIVKEMIRFKTNAGGEITGIDTIVETSAELETTDDIKYPVRHTFTMNWTQWFLGNNIPFFLDASTVIFLIPENKNKEADYKIINNTALTAESSWTLDFYNTDDFQQVVFAKMEGSVTAAAETVPHYLVESIRDAVIDADEGIYGYKVVTKELVNGRAKGKGSVKDTTFTVDKERFEANPFAVGDFLTATFEKSEATAWTILKPGGFVGDTDEVRSTGQQTRRYVTGTIKRIDVARMYVIIEADVNGTKQEILTCPRAKAIINTTTKKAREVTMSDFHVGDRVFVCTNYGNSDFIFKNEQ